MNSLVRVRFAPSPTGNLHVGGARAAIFNWLYARAKGGMFLLRIEDTDAARSRDEHKDAIIRDLEWMGISSDEQIVIQSHNTSHHISSANQLIQKGYAYRCFCKSEAIEELRENNEEANFKYPGLCLKLSQHDVDALMIAGAPFVVRLAVSKLSLYENLEFEDLIRGNISVCSDIIDDFVIIKSDGIATYNFAVCLDDISMRITHVLRGEEHILNTFKQIILYDLFKAQVPLFGHLPMILGPNGEKLSKRHGATAVNDYKLQGILPQALFNYLVRLGWSYKDQEIFSQTELQSLFDISGVGKKNSIFDSVKLNWFNAQYMKNMSFNEFVKAVENIDSDLGNFFETEFRELRLKKFFETFLPRYCNVVDLAKELYRIETRWESVALYSVVNELDLPTLELARDFFSNLLEAIEKQSNNPSWELDTATVQDVAKKVQQALGVQTSVIAKVVRTIFTGNAEGPSFIEITRAFNRYYFKTILDELIKKISEIKNPRF